MLLPTSLHDLGAISELPAESWETLFEAAGWPAGIVRGRKLEPEGILRALTGADNLPEVLLDALDVLHHLGTDAGREALRAAAADQNLDISAWKEQDAPRELAVRMWIASRSNDASQRALLLARMRVQEGPAERPVREFAGKTARAATTLAASTVEKRVAAWCRENRRGEDVQVVAYERNGEHRFEILHGHLMQQVLHFKSSRPARLSFRPAYADHVRYDPSTGRLGVAARSRAMAPFYCVLFGELIAGDSEFFASEDICTLRPLQERGSALFICADGGPVQRVDLVEMQWSWNDRESVKVKAPDCFAAVAQMGVPLRQGSLKEARLRIWVAGRGRAALISVKVPNRLHIPPGPDEGIIEAYLTEIGIRDTSAGQERLDLWSLYPWRLPERRWRQFLGQDFDLLYRRGFFRGIRLAAVEHPGHPASPLALTVQTLSPGQVVGIGDDDVPSRTLTESDVQGYELSAARLAQELKGALGLTGNEREMTPGLWEVGRKPLGRVRIAVFAVFSTPASVTADQLLRSAGTDVPVALIPDGETNLPGIVTVQARLPAGPFDGLIPAVAQALGPAADIPAPQRARPGTRLVVDPVLEKVWVDKVELTELVAGSHAYKFALTMARNVGRRVSKEELRQALSPKNPTDLVKSAKHDFGKAARASFEAQKVSVPPDLSDFFSAGGGGYLIDVTAVVV
jgi:hypothetical protein